MYADRMNEKPWEMFSMRRKPMERRHLLKDGTIVRLNVFDRKWKQMMDRVESISEGFEGLH